MKRLLLLFALILAMTMPVQAEELTPPAPPDNVSDLMPVERNSFGEDLWYVVCTAVGKLEPDITKCATICLSVVAVVMIVSVLDSFPGKAKSVTELAGAVAVGCLTLGAAAGVIQSAVQTIQALSDYGKLLLPVMTTALAAQGGVTGSAALYTGTAVFNTVLGWLISRALIPMIYIYLVLVVASAAIKEELLGKLQQFIKWLSVWSLKVILYVFTGYMTITGVISGTTDQTALKATKLAISGMVPVVGGILSDASETILVSAGVVKNTLGVYGLTALVAIVIGPFLSIGIQYLLLKMTASVCATFRSKTITTLIMDISGAMGLLLAMTGTVCLLLMISMVCFMKGVI